jgi:hypothetical protein
VHLILFIFLGFILLSTTCEFFCMYWMKKDRSPLFFNKSHVLLQVSANFFASFGTIKNTNLCTRDFPRPHSFEKGVSQ